MAVVVPVPAILAAVVVPIDVVLVAGLVPASTMASLGAARVPSTSRALAVVIIAAAIPSMGALAATAAVAVVNALVRSGWPLALAVTLRLVPLVIVLAVAVAVMPGMSARLVVAGAASLPVIG